MATQLTRDSGSAYKEYLAKGTVHGIKLPAGLKESAKLDPPIFTPSTKAAIGDKDENVHPDKRGLHHSARPSS
jgi:phosphoribosylaminoimidazole-succinocarboxamide synthase